MRGEYTPTTDSRFLISDDPISQQRYRAVQDTAVELNSVPYFAGMVLGGSLSKGRVLDQSCSRFADIDITVFLNWEECQEKIEQFNLETFEQMIQGCLTVNLARRTGDFLSLSFRDRRVFCDLGVFPAQAVLHKPLKHTWLT